MAIAFDAISVQGQSNATSVTISHTITGSNTLLVVGIIYQTTTDDVTGVTWAGTAMVKSFTGLSFNSTERYYIYTLLGAVTGTNNIVVSKTGASVYVTFRGSSFTGVKQTSAFVSADANGNSTTATVSVTTPSDNNWLYMVGRAGNNPTAGANTTIRSGTSTAGVMGDSNALQTPAGSYSQTFTQVSGAWGIAAMSFEPVVVGATANPAFLMNFL